MGLALAPEEPVRAVRRAQAELLAERSFPHAVAVVITTLACYHRLYYVTVAFLFFWFQIKTTVLRLRLA